MELYEYLNIVKRRIWIVIIPALIFTLAVLAVNIWLLPKVYEASTTLIISNHRKDIRTNSLEYDDILISQVLVKTYSIIVKSDRVMDQVIADLKLDITPKELRKRIHVDSVEETEILKISVEDTVPEKAMITANTVASIFQEQVKGILQLENVQIIDDAKLPDIPVRPRVLRNLLIGLGIGIIFGLGSAFMAEYMDDSIKSSESIEKNTGLLVLGTIPDMYPKSGNNPELLSTTSIEAYKLMRTNIQYANAEKPNRSILITSCNSSEGKTTTSVNLAIRMAESNKRTLLLDCDLRRPSVHEYFQVPNNLGITNVLLEGVDYRTVVIPTIYPNLSIMTSGPPVVNSLEQLESERMIKLLNDAMEEYDVVILDTPPICLFSEGVVLSRIVDATLLVVHYGKTTLRELKKASAVLNRINANLLGTVINKYPVKKTGTYYGYEI